MVTKSIGICDSVLSEDTCLSLQELVVQDKGAEFLQAKKDVLRHALPEIVNHVSDSNVEVAANISELVVEYTLHSLEKINHKMVRFPNCCCVQMLSALLYYFSSGCRRKYKLRINKHQMLKSPGISPFVFKKTTVLQKRRKSEFVALTQMMMMILVR